MTERGSRLDRYQIMTPQQGNAEMRGLFEVLPDYSSNFNSSYPKSSAVDSINQRIHDFSQNRKRRENSELNQDLTARIKTLLSFAEITDSFKSYINIKYTNYLGTGILKRDLEIDGQVAMDSEIGTEDAIFQWINPENGGIFDQREARDIEAKAYNKEVSFRLRYLDYALEGDQEWKEVIDQWRIEFIERYGDEP